MNKFNLPRRNIAKERRAKRAEKRKLRSSAATLKVSSATTPSGISGKKARKLQKRWRQAQKEALQSGLVTVHDIEMMAIDGEGGGEQGSSKPKLPKLGRSFLMKKRAKLRLKCSSSKGKLVDPWRSSSLFRSFSDTLSGIHRCEQWNIAIHCYSCTYSFIHSGLSPASGTCSISEGAMARWWKNGRVNGAVISADGRDTASIHLAMMLQEM